MFSLVLRDKMRWAHKLGARVGHEMYDGLQLEKRDTRERDGSFVGSWAQIGW